MAENHDEMLNELIKYYDGETVTVNIHKEDIKSQTDPAEENEAQQPLQDGGETLRIDAAEIKKLREEKHAPQETVRIDTKNLHQKADQPEPADEYVQDEVLGLLGIDGKPIAPIPDIPMPHEVFYEEDTPDTVEEQDYDYTPKRDRADNDEISDELPADGTRGIWFLLKPLWVTIIVCALILAGFKFYITDTGIIGSYKRNFSYNMSYILDMLGISFDFDNPDEATIGEQNDKYVTLADNTPLVESTGSADSQTYTETGTDNEHQEPVSAYSDIKGDTVSLPFDKAGSSVFTVSDDGVVCAKSNYVCCINKKGSVVWEAQTPVTDPAVSSAGKYTAVAAKGGTQICVFRNGKLIYSTDTHNSIVSCSISERGDLALITERSGYKGSVLVYNRNGEEIFSWSSGVNYITSAAMLKTRLVSVSLVSASESVSSYIMLFDVKQPQPISGIEMAGTLVFDTKSAGRQVLIDGDSSIAAFTGLSTLKYDMRFDDVRLTHMASDRSGNRIVSYNKNNSPVLCIYSRNGSIEYDSIIESDPDCVDIYGTTMLYNNGRQVICGRYTGNDLTSYTASTAVQRLILMDSGTYMIVYNNSLEIVKI